MTKAAKVIAQAYKFKSRNKPRLGKRRMSKRELVARQVTLPQ